MTSHAGGEVQRRTRPERLVVAGIPVDTMVLAEVLLHVRRAIESREKLLLTTANAFSAALALDDPDFLAHFQQADIVLPDGITMVWLSRLLGPLSIEAKITGIIFFDGFARLAEQEGFSVFFLGSTPEVIAKIQERLAVKHPRLRIAGCHSPPFGELSEEDDAELVRRINEAAPDLLLVGMTAPKQELWLSRNLAGLEVPVKLGIGAAFDYLAGTKPRPPDWIAHAGLEAPFRVFNEPRRIWPRVLPSAEFFCRALWAQRRDLFRGQGKRRDNGTR